MPSFDAADPYGWATSADAWIRTVESDLNRTVLLDPLMLQLCGDVSDSSILDLGCGEGRFARMLAGNGAKVIGIDPTRTLIEAAKSAACGPRYVCGSAETLPFVNDAFDMVVSYVSLVDVPDFEAAIRESARVLKSTGKFVVANLHPMASAVPGWVRDEHGNRLFWKLDRYFEEVGEVASWNGIEVLNWHRPLEAYVGASLSAGLRLERLIEPRPSDDVAARHPTIGDHRRVPNFLVTIWTKP